MYKLVCVLCFILIIAVAAEEESSETDFEKENLEVSKNCKKHLHECQTMQVVLSVMCMVFFITNIATIGFWQREPIIALYHRILNRLTGNNEAEYVHHENAYGD